MTFPAYYYRRTRRPGAINGVTMPGDIVNISSLALWVRASDIVGNDGDAIGSWTDRSPRANNLTQGTATAKPTLKTNIVNGYAVARFDGGDSMTLTSAIAASPVQICAVVKPTTLIASCTLLAGAGAGSFQLRSNGTGKLNLVKSGVVELGTATTQLSSVNFNNIGASYSNPNFTFRLASAADGSGSSAQTMTGMNVLGKNYNGEAWQGDIAEVLVFNALLDAGTLAIVEEYLLDRYGV